MRVGKDTRHTHTHTHTHTHRSPPPPTHTHTEPHRWTGREALTEWDRQAEVVPCNKTASGVHKEDGEDKERTHRGEQKKKKKKRKEKNKKKRGKRERERRRTGA